MCGAEHERGPDADLIRSLQAGEAGAFDVLFERHRRGLLAYVYGMLRDRNMSEDVVQDAFLQFVRRIDTIRPEQGAAPWLYRTARNRTYDLLRKHRRETVGLDGLAARDRMRGEMVDHETATDRLVRQDDIERVRRALDSLPAKERDLLVMRFYGGTPFKTMAAAVRRPLGTVLWQVHRSLKKLRAFLESDNTK